MYKIKVVVPLNKGYETNEEARRELFNLIEYLKDIGISDKFAMQFEIYEEK